MFDGEKTCAKCKITKPTQEFHRKKDGLDSRCRECKKLYQAAWYQKNRERQIASAAKWQKENKDRVRNKNAAWRARNPGRQEAATASWRAANPERAAANEYRNNARRRARILAATTVEFTSDQLFGKWSYWGARCWICGGEAVANDHVKPLSKGGAHMLCNLRPICKPCNSQKGNTWPYVVNYDAS
ncbi:HNH endonuclease [Mycobacteroides chelonae]|uniref:HNH endonuclease n=1 Tax=Mycobacteroides chelonae TaxID=1774 RepID=UPI00096AAA0F